MIQFFGDNNVPRRINLELVLFSLLLPVITRKDYLINYNNAIILVLSYYLKSTLEN